MKKIVFILGILLPMFSYSQLTPGGSVVYDPTQAANMSTQISNSATQIKQLEKSLEYMKKASQKLEQVNDYLRDIEDLKQISKMYKESFSIAQKIRTNLPKIKNPELRAYYINEVTSSLSSINNSVTFINKILTSKFFSMSDKDRMDLIKKEKHKIFLKKSRLISLTI